MTAMVASTHQIYSVDVMSLFKLGYALEVGGWMHASERVHTLHDA